MNIISAALISALPFAAAVAQPTTPPLPEANNLTYTRTLDSRAAKIVASLGALDATKSNQVHRVLVEQYRALNEIHSRRDAQIQHAKTLGDKNAAQAAAQTARDEAQPKLDRLHADFLGKLAAELSATQVDQVKDGMTYGVLSVTYNAYLKSFPSLTEEQKTQLKAWLVEAREQAMDQGSSEEKHAVFGKYKGRINNYLVKAGYDLKQGERNLRKPAAPPPNPMLK